ncbi:hypothetical protein ACHAC9_05565 [Massilia sp. CMS3.1]|uniref:hypothetical protein n=1 Tax=Massilia sp. CMS3.1 TaxID=3373083 RepID=UPI003EE52773
MLAALAMFAAAALHVVALLAGPEMIAALGAPASIVESARQGSLLAPLATLGIALALAVIGLYAWSAAATRSLPFQRFVLGAAACVFILRAAALPAVLFIAPAARDQLSLFEVATSLLCFLIGIAFLPAVRKRVEHSSRVNAA